MIQPVPRYPTEGKSILLQVHNLPEDLQAFSWYKSKYGASALKIVEYSRDKNSVFWGPVHRGRGMVYYNGSLMLQDVTEKDAGMYTLEVLKKDSKVENASVEFSVKKYVTQPSVRITDTTVEGRRSVIFTCISPDTDISIRWIFNNKSLHHLERMTLSPTKCGLRIDPVQREDAGEYKCILMQREDVILEWIFLPRKPNKKLKTYIEKISDLIHKDKIRPATRYVVTTWTPELSDALAIGSESISGARVGLFEPTAYDRTPHPALGKGEGLGLVPSE
ncbi:hypothetical protein STEG23_027534 [Scotinomys teguina]